MPAAAYDYFFPGFSRGVYPGYYRGAYPSYYPGYNPNSYRGAPTEAPRGAPAERRRRSPPETTQSVPSDTPRRAPADTAAKRSQPAAPREAKKLPAANAVKGPLIIAISVASQRLTVYDNGEAVAHAPVSTGTADHPTPMGVFSVIQKERFHRSNIYSGAPMPFMQRITWSGVALHAGVLPGYPASHGCIRMPPDFAVKLYGLTRVGARVVITRNDVTPIAFEHARLTALKKSEPLSQTGALSPAMEQSPIGVRKDAIRTADATSATNSSMVDAKPENTTASDATPKAAGSTTPEPAAAKTAPAAPAAAVLQPDAPLKSREASAPAETITPAAARADEPALAPAQASVVEPAPVSNTEPDTSPGSRDATATVKLEASPAALLAPSVSALQAPAPEVGAPQMAVPEPSAPAAAGEALPMTAALPIDEVFVPPSRPLRPLRTGPVSVFVSRKEGRLFVRKGFEPLFSVPVTIAQRDQPIGTHVFTAADLKVDGVSLRWFAISLPSEAVKPVESRLRPGRADRAARVDTTARNTTSYPTGTSAAEALDRIDLTPELAERLSALMSVGASLIISDQGLGDETGLETDFIVVTAGIKSRSAAPRGAPVASSTRKRRTESTSFWQ